MSNGERGESSGWKPTVAKAFTKALLFLCLRARNRRESTRGKAVREATRQRKIAEREAEVAVDMPVVSAAVNTKII